jgi:hypothetical protein
MEKSSLEYYYDLETEVGLFYKWLFEKDQRFHRDLIYKNFPELLDIHLNVKKLSKPELCLILKEVIVKFREKYAETIEIRESDIIKNLPVIIEGINALERIMCETEYFKYLIMPSVYPTCPFDVKRNLFYFSITGVQDGKISNDRLSTTALHEISHFIFFRQIAKITHKLSDRGIHHLKEVLTPVILEHPDILKYRHDKKIGGNPESVKYQVEIDGRVLSIFDYVFNQYFKNPTPEGYMSFLFWLIHLFEKIEPEVLKRDNLFAKNGRAVFTDPVLNTEFMEPIKLE